MSAEDEPTLLAVRAKRELVRATTAQTDDERRELERLRQIEPEYRVALQVVAVLTERLLAATAGTALVIDDDALAHSPDLVADRDVMLKRLKLSTSR